MGAKVARIVMANEGTPIMLNYVLQRAVNNYADWLLMMWVDAAYSPAPASVYADLTEATFTGYSRRTLAHATWQAPTIVSGTYAQSLYDTTPLSWTNSGVTSETVYGYAVITPTASKILWLQKFDTPVLMVPGGTVVFTPSIDLGTLP